MAPLPLPMLPAGLGVGGPSLVIASEPRREVARGVPGVSMEGRRSRIPRKCSGELSWRRWGGRVSLPLPLLDVPGIGILGVGVCKGVNRRFKLLWRSTFVG
jgi:hypothetical protein